jgi:hypothetical protein
MRVLTMLLTAHVRIVGITKAALHETAPSFISAHRVTVPAVLARLVKRSPYELLCGTSLI